MKVNFYLMKSKKSLLVLPSKKATKWVKLMKHGKSKTCFAMWMARWKTVQTNGDKEGEVIYLGKNLTDSELF